MHLLSMASCVLQHSDGGSLKLSNVGGDSEIDLEGEEFTCGSKWNIRTFSLIA